MLSSYSHQKNILQSANNLLANSVLYNVLELKKLNLKGCRLALYKCDYCDKLFNHINDEAIFAFFCGHKYHLQCCMYSDSEEISCDICKKNEFDYNTTYKNTATSIDSNKLKDNNTGNLDSVESNFKKGRQDHYLNRLKEFDKIMLDRELLINSIK